MVNFFYIKTFGCQININDSKIINNLLLKINFKKVNDINSANTFIVNTCSVRDNSHKKLYKYLNKIQKIFKNKNNLLLIISGCISNYLTKHLICKFNFINIILSTKNLYFLPYLIKMYYFYKCKQIKINFISFDNYNIYEKKEIIQSNYITITEGCNKYCSYCIVPYSRGIEVSFYLSLILNKILILKKKNKYIYLLGQNVNSYLGKLKIKSNKYINFILLLNYINQIFFIKFIIFLTSNPSDFKIDLIKNYKINNKIYNLLHLPIQSCSNKILNLMNRDYKLINYKIILNKLKNIRYSIIFTTDILLCFPGENNCDFYKTLIFVEKFLFDKSYIFLYSPRPYTNSFYFFNKFDNILKNKRFNIIIYKIKNNIKYINKLMIGKTEYVYVKNYFFFENNLYISLTNNNKVIYFYYNFNHFLLKKVIKLKIIKFLKGFFYGEILF